nr:fibrohexamerin-2 [Pseudoips prasinana]
MEMKILSLVAVAFASSCSANVVQIYRPCCFNDHDCIANILQVSSGCKKIDRGIGPKQFEYPEFRFQTPYFNATYIDRNLIVRNTDRCFISEFYINPTTDKAVLGVDCPDRYHEADRTMIQHRSLREDGIYNFHINALYPLVRLTIVFSLKQQMDLCQAHTFAEVLGLPQIKVSPGDRPTAKFLSRDLTLLNVYETENFFCRSTGMGRIFVQSVLCDYGCPISSICNGQ